MILYLISYGLKYTCLHSAHNNCNYCDCGTTKIPI